jgi:hypothetical protein
VLVGEGPGGIVRAGQRHPIVFTAAPASADADKLSLIRTIGLQGLTGMDADQVH